jgi:hypothetical protein
MGLFSQMKRKHQAYPVPMNQTFSSASYVVNNEFRCWERIQGELAVVPNDEQLEKLLSPYRARYQGVQARVVDVQLSQGNALVYLQS